MPVFSMISSLNNIFISMKCSINNKVLQRYSGLNSNLYWFVNASKDIVLVRQSRTNMFRLSIAIRGRQEYCYVQGCN